MKSFLIRWLVTTIAVAAAVYFSGIKAASLGALMGASLLLGIVNAFVRPVLLMLCLPLILVSMGFFILIINALMLLLVGRMIPGFEVPGFGAAFFGAIVISIVSWLLSAFFKGSDGHVYALTHHTRIKNVQGRVIEQSEPGSNNPR